MSPDQIHLVRASFARLGPDRVAVGEGVYRHVFAMAPYTQALFHGHIRDHATNLMGRWP